MAGRYRTCPSCRSEKEGASVKKCKKCNSIFCSECELNSWTATCPGCRGNDTTVLGYIRNGSSGRGCFITTATLQSRGISDDNCAELLDFRRLRDEFICIEFPESISEYYEVAPKIVEKINNQSFPEKFYAEIWDNHLKKCLYSIRKGNYPKATSIYFKMIEELKRKYLN